MGTPLRTVLALLLFAGSALAQDRLFLTEYKFEDPALLAMDLDGGNPADLFSPGQEIPAADWLTVGLALDEGAGKIYWNHGSTPGRIRRANLDGSGQELLVSGLRNSRGLAVDTVRGKMYWAASPPSGSAGGLIQRANLDGSGLETVYLDPDYDPVSSKIGRPRVDAINGWVYFASNDRILRSNLDGPPFVTFQVVTGVSTARAVALDVAQERIYWIGADTIEDVVCRARLDNTGFEVVYDLSPDTGGSNGLSDLVLDLAGGSYLICDDLRDEVLRGALDGSSLLSVYTAATGWSPSAMTLDAEVPQALADCNGNGTPDAEDVLGGASEDCNANGIPDECEDDPCAPVAYLLDQSDNPTSPSLQLGGAPQNQSWMIFQPIDVPEGGWEVGEIRLSGVTWTYRPEGFTATLLPDTGGDYPDESQPIASGSAFFRFGMEWVSVTIAASLPQGRHWLRLVANDDNHYLATVSTVASGPPAMSRSGLGNDFPGRPPVALRILGSEDLTAAADFDLRRELSLRLLTRSPSARTTAMEFVLGRTADTSLAIFDVRGRRVKTLRSGRLQAGAYRAEWDGDDAAGERVAAGVYLARLQTGSQRRSLKLLRLE